MSAFRLDPDVRAVTMRTRQGSDKRPGDRAPAGGTAVANTRQAGETGKDAESGQAARAGQAAQTGQAGDATPAGELVLEGLLGLPPDPVGLVLFAHGSGSSRFSPRNNAVARRLRNAGLGTLLFDLLDGAESADRANVFDIELLATRLEAATEWAGREPGCVDLPFGYFGASTGAAAALRAAANLRDRIGAVVSRGGRPDLALDVLHRVTAPTLLIVGGYDVPVIDMNETAYRRLSCEKAMELVPAATHLFEEPGALERVSSLAADWFVSHLSPAG